MLEIDKPKWREGGREGEGRKGRRGAYFMHTPGLFSLSPSNPVDVSGNKNNSSTFNHKNFVYPNANKEGGFTSFSETFEINQEIN